MNTPEYAVNVPPFRRYIPISIVIILTLIQGLLIVGCEYAAYHVYDCKPDNINLGMILFFKYFGGEKCDYSKSQTPIVSPAQSPDHDVPQTASITIEEFNNHLPPTVAVADRVYTEIVVYGVINVLWIITSILALGGCICKAAGRAQFCILFAPWFLVVIAGCLLDLVATVFHIIDITNTRSLESVLDYLGIENPASLSKYKNFSKDYSTIPIIAVCITSKLVILWLVNLFGSSMAIAQIKKIAYNRKPSTFFNEYNSNKPETQQNDEMSIKGEILNSNNNSQITNYHRDSSTNSVQESNERKDKNEILRRITQSYGRQPSEENNYQIGEGSQNRLSSGSGASNIPSAKEKVHLTEELRSQLPWTYLNFSKDLSKSIKVLQHHEEHDVAPPVPVPDYETDYHAPATSSQSNQRVLHRPSSINRPK